MNYEEAVAYIEETPKFTTKNKMEHTKECLKRIPDFHFERSRILLRTFYLAASGCDQ